MKISLNIGEMFELETHERRIVSGCADRIVQRHLYGREGPRNYCTEAGQAYTAFKNSGIASEGESVPGFGPLPLTLDGIVTGMEALAADHVAAISGAFPEPGCVVWRIMPELAAAVTPEGVMLWLYSRLTVEAVNTDALAA